MFFSDQVFAILSPNMLQGSYWMVEEHSGACIAHNVPDLCSHVGLVTMFWAQTTSFFVIFERTVVQPCSGICQQRLAIVA